MEEEKQDHSGRWKLGVAGCGCSVLLYLALPLLVPFIYPWFHEDHYEENSSYNGHYICPKGKLLQLFASLKPLSQEDRFAYVQNAPNAGVSATAEDVAEVSVIVWGEHVDLAVFNHNSLKDDQNVPGAILPLLKKYDAALNNFGCRKGEVTLGTERNKL
jgi:hypothetical protein